MLRAGGTARVLGFTAKAPSTLGAFLRGFRWGHARQRDRVSRELLARAWAVGAGPGDSPLTIDLDSTICETSRLTNVVTQRLARQVVRRWRNPEHRTLVPVGSPAVPPDALRTPPLYQFLYLSKLAGRGTSRYDIINVGSRIPCCRVFEDYEVVSRSRDR